MKAVAQKVGILLIVFLVGGCGAMSGVEKTGSMPGFDIFTVRSADKMGINTASTFLVDQKDGKLAYGNTAAQPGVGKNVVEQILPAASTVALGTTAGVLLPRPTSNISAGNVGNNQQGQFQGQQQQQKAW